MIPAAAFAFCLACGLGAWIILDRPRASWLKLYEQRVAKQDEAAQEQQSGVAFFAGLSFPSMPLRLSTRPQAAPDERQPLGLKFTL